MSVRETFLETARQSAANDGKFYRNYTYFFELRIPSSVLGLPGGFTPSLLFPLVMNPRIMTTVDPFTVQATPGADGGLTVEENGIIQRMLHIEGTTGFKPRPNRAWMVGEVKNNNPSFTPRGKLSPLAVSGQRHFQFLQDRVFRTYGDLKRDPTTAKDTSLMFHNIKDDEHWIVVPREFRLDRNASQPASYNYTIDLMIVDKADAHPGGFPSPDKSWLDSVKDSIASVRAAVNLLTGLVKDAIKFVKEIENVVANFGGIMRDIIGFVNTVSDLISGVADLIAAPFNQIASLVNALDDAIDKLGASAVSAVDTVIAGLYRMQDAFDTFAQHPELFESEVRTVLRRLSDRSQISSSVSATALADAAANPPTSLAALAARGTAPLPGDEDKARAESGRVRNIPNFNSVFERIVTATDTIQSLAGTFLGDPSLWDQIAVLNDLRYPYISATGLPNTIKPGAIVLIPSTARTTTVFGPNIVGASPEDVLPVRLLGTDLALEASNARADKFDIKVNPGRTDASIVAGVDNLIQAMKFRLSVDIGSDILYPNLGHHSMVGLNILSIDDEILRIRLGEAIAADPRIASVLSTRLQTSSPDIIDVEIDASVAGFSEPVTLITEQIR